jgi:small subunit ribosomal protein S8
MTDPIADYLTRLRNAIKANHRIVEIPSSKLKKEITKVLFEKGYILNYKFDDVQNHQGTIKIALKYHPVFRCINHAARYQWSWCCNTYHL